VAFHVGRSETPFFACLLDGHGNVTTRPIAEADLVPVTSKLGVSRIFLAMFEAFLSTKVERVAPSAP